MEINVEKREENERPKSGIFTDRTNGFGGRQLGKGQDILHDGEGAVSGYRAFSGDVEQWVSDSGRD